jgi:hypothetical protein
MKKTLTPKMRKWLKFYLDESNGKTFWNRSASAKAAGYKCSSPAGFENVGSQNFRKMADYIESWLDERGLSEARLKELLVDGLQAYETKFFQKDGKVVETRTAIPWEIRRKYLEMAMKIKGMFAPEKHEIFGKDGGAIDLTALVMEVTKDNE